MFVYAAYIELQRAKLEVVVPCFKALSRYSPIEKQLKPQINRYSGRGLNITTPEGKWSELRYRLTKPLDLYTIFYAMWK